MNKYILYPFLCAFFSALTLLLQEVALQKYSIQPIVFAFFISTIGGIFLFLFVGDKKDFIKHIVINHPLLFLSASFFTYCLSFIFAFYSITSIGATKVSFALQLETLFIILFSFLLLKEKINLRKCIAASLILFGGFLLNFSFLDFHFALTGGDIFAILSALSFSIGIILTTKLLHNYHALSVTGAGMLAGGVFLFAFILLFYPFLFYFNYFSYSNYFSFYNFYIILFIFIIGLLEGFIWLLYNKGLEFVGASLTSIIFSTIPFFTLVFSFLFNLLLISDFFLIPKNLFAIIFGGVLMFIGTCFIDYHSK